MTHWLACSRGRVEFASVLQVHVRFVIEHEDQIWFGGEPWERFRSVGFYRIDPRTGEFRLYDLRDGFQMSTTYETYAGVPIGNDLWLATSAGLARVTSRK